MRSARLKRIVAIVVVLGCASYVVLNSVDGVRLWLAYRSCKGSCVFYAASVGPSWIVASLWVLSLLAAAAIGIWLTRRLIRRPPAPAVRVAAAVVAVVRIVTRARSDRATSLLDD